MKFRNPFSRREREPRSLVAPDGSVRVEPVAPRPRPVVRVVEQRRSPGVLGWLLALGAGAAIALVAVVAVQDPRSIGTQLDSAVSTVKDAGNEVSQTVAATPETAAEASRQAMQGVSAALDDAGITAKVKAALAVDPALKASRIDVSTSNGVVRLEGPAPDAAAKERATVLATAPQGVRGVDNRLALPQPSGVVATAEALPTAPQR